MKLGVVKKHDSNKNACMKSFFHKYKHLIQGSAYVYASIAFLGILSLLLTFLSLGDFVWYFIVSLLLILVQIEMVFGGVELITKIDGGMFTFGIAYPNIYGWIVLNLLLIFLGLGIGLFLKLVKIRGSKKFSKYLLLAPLLLLSVCVSFLIYLGLSTTLQRCQLVFDGQYSANRSKCYLDALESVDDFTNINQEYCYKNIPIHVPIQDTQDYRAQCLRFLAEKKLDVEICALIPDDPYDSVIKERCYFYFIDNKINDVSICEIPTLQSIRDRCYTEFAQRTDDVTLCGLSVSTELKDECYFKQARDINEPKFCELITRESERDNCFKRMAARNHDINSCQKINNKSYREDCINDIQ